ncbi:D-lactaldehyde dehydrogenase [Cantharellus anzutake]|uniref:D-lactaldehyde dehydrogenase n=1 Tax=Cantharellus anzutake TaxID=1750568 RepID=UPI0019035EE7|nr:D-lactaldehyde dehydrogenase [Cantharellus anzutake]KAF8331072.1 D-lactaldehyde dehydrogenase [Cantharellus anzutake]
MPGVTAPSKVLVTGASGFLASWIVKTLLDRGYRVVGTVQSSLDGDYLKSLFGDEFNYAVVPDIGFPNACDEVVKEANPDAIIHTASPCVLNTEDPQWLIDTAVKGTLGLLESAKLFGANVQRVVITSSISAATEPKQTSVYNFTESDWNTYSPKIVDEQRNNAPGVHKYRASKALAERAAWKFVQDNELSWDLTTLLPSMVFGPVIHKVKDLASLNASLAAFLDQILHPGKSPALSTSFVDVRDVGEAHFLALSHPEAGGQRFIASAREFYWQEITNVLQGENINVPSFNEREDTSISQSLTIDSSKAQRVLGLKFRSLEEAAIDAYKSLKERFPSDIP